MGIVIVGGNGYNRWLCSKLDLGIGHSKKFPGSWYCFVKRVLML